MKRVTPPIQEGDLHAYIDGQLDAERRLAVERYLAANPEATHRVSVYKDQRDLLREAFANGTAASPPPKLSLDGIVGQRSHRQPQPWLFAASVAVALGAGLAGGWLMHAAPVPGRTQHAMAVLEQQALASHAVYAVDRRHPVEVASSETPQLQQWLSERLNRNVVVPDLSAFGYRLIGGRLLATENGGAAAMLMYEDANQQRISLLLRPMGAALHAPDVPIQRNGVNGRAWIANGLGVAVVAAVPAADIARLATRIGEDLGMRG